MKVNHQSAIEETSSSGDNSLFDDDFGDENEDLLGCIPLTYN